MFLYQNNNKNASINNHHDDKKIDDMLQIGFSIQNNQIETMEILHLLHSMQEKVIKLLTVKFDKFEKHLHELHDNGKKEIIDEILLLMTDGNASIRSSQKQYDQQQSQVTKQRQHRMPKKFKLHNNNRSSTFDDSRSGKECKKLLIDKNESEQNKSILDDKPSFDVFEDHDVFDNYRSALSEEKDRKNDIESKNVLSSNANEYYDIYRKESCSTSKNNDDLVIGGRLEEEEETNTSTLETISQIFNMNNHIQLKYSKQIDNSNCNSSSMQKNNDSNNPYEHNVKIQESQQQNVDGMSKSNNHKSQSYLNNLKETCSNSKKNLLSQLQSNKNAVLLPQEKDQTETKTTKTTTILSSKNKMNLLDQKTIQNDETNILSSIKASKQNDMDNRKFPEYVCIPGNLNTESAPPSNQTKNERKQNNDDRPQKNRNVQQPQNSLKLLVTRQLSQSSLSINHKKGLFDQFFLISVNPSSLSMKQQLLENMKYDNNNYDDSLMFHTQYGCWSLIHPHKFRNKMDLIDQYPAAGVNENGSLSFEEISSMCFPSGIKARIVPKYAINTAKQLYNYDKPKYQLHTFVTNVENDRSNNHANNNPTMHYGVSITVQEIIDVASTNKETSKYLRYLSKRRIAAIRIKNAMRNYVLFRRSRKNKIKRRRHSIADLKNMTMNANTAVIEQSMHEFSRRFSFSSHMLKEDNYNTNVSLDATVLSVKTNKTVRFPEHVLRQANEAYENMIISESLGNVIIIEKCYTFIGSSCLQTQSLLLNCLQTLINHEKKMGPFITTRHEVLELMQSNKSLSMLDQKKCQETKESNCAIVSLGDPQPSLSIPTPLPQLTSEWGVARLFLKTQSISSLLQILNLLLLERSVLVIGTNYEDVTFCTRALLDLICPFQWCSAYISLIPDYIIDFVSSPVPFVAGYVGENDLDLNCKILNDNRVHLAIANGMSVIDLCTGRIIITNEKICNDVLMRNSYDSINDQLVSHQNKLKSICNEKEHSSLLEFQRFFQHGASNEEKFILTSIKQIMFSHYSYMSNCISLSSNYYNNYSLPVSLPNAMKTKCHWKMYGISNNTTDAFEYIPSMLVNKLHLDFLFYEIMVHTQLFSGYVENELKYYNATIFIVDWLSYKWWMRCSKGFIRRNVDQIKDAKSSRTISMYIHKKERKR